MNSEFEFECVTIPEASRALDKKNTNLTNILLKLKEKSLLENKPNCSCFGR